MNARGSKPDIFFNPRNISAIKATGEGSAQVILVSGLSYDIAESAENLVIAAEADIAERHITSVHRPTPLYSTDVLAEPPLSRGVGTRNNKNG